ESQTLDDNQRTHHVVLFMLQNVAMPDVLIAASPGAHGNGKRQAGWQVELHDHGGAFAGIHAYGFLPALLVRLRPARRSAEIRYATEPADLERLPLAQLHIGHV